MAGVTPSENFFAGHGACLLPKFLNILDSAIDFLLSNARLGNYPSDGPPMPADDNSLAALHLVEQSGKMRLGFGGLNFSRHVS